jgi:hypothetical protein
MLLSEHCPKRAIRRALELAIGCIQGVQDGDKVLAILIQAPLCASNRRLSHGSVRVNAKRMVDAPRGEPFPKPKYNRVAEWAGN